MTYSSMQMTSRITLFSLLPILFLLMGTAAQFDEPNSSSSDAFQKAEGLATGVIIAIIVGVFKSTTYTLYRPELKLAFNLKV